MKRFHSIEILGTGKSEIIWVDEYGHEGKVDSTESAQFQKEHPGSVYTARKDFYKKLEQVRAARAKLGVWKEMTR